MTDNADLGAVALRILRDLDRCPHGRHEGDYCSGLSGCNGPSLGNPLIKTGTIIGYTLYATEVIVMPEPRLRYDPMAWIVQRSELDR